MDFEDALQAADRLATQNGVQLGTCLFEYPLEGGCWAFAFDIIDGPQDWSWTVVVNEAHSDELFLAVRNRPHPLLTPRIKRKWFIGCRQVRLPYG